ncbi:MAG: DUF1211 domain-containing protein [Solirubrobacterales bacterium]|nr:DUF1211 domain-containing protein [Solirubrobacterales bacterium]
MGLLPKNRLEAFSDGVLAIVITILVLELEVPEVAGPDGLLHTLGEEWRSYLGYLISFVFVGGNWVAHSNATRLIDKGDPILFRLTLLWLLFVSLIPFATALMTNFIGQDGEHTAVAIYGIDLFLASVLLTVLIRYSASVPGLASSELSDEDLMESVRERNWLLVIQALAVVTALFLPEVALFLYLLASLLFLVVPLLAARKKPA